MSRKCSNEYTTNHDTCDTKSAMHDIRTIPMRVRIADEVARGDNLMEVQQARAQLLKERFASVPVFDANSRQAEARYLNSFIRGMGVTQIIGVVCECGVPDAVPETGVCSIESLAYELGVDGNTLLRLTRALSAFGIFNVDAEGRITHNACSRMLRRGQYPSQHWAARFWTSPGAWQAWGGLRHTLQRGEEAFKQVCELQFFDYMLDHTDEAETYRQYMASGYPGRHAAIAEILELAESTTVVDVGGGTGSLVRALLERNPTISGIVYDQPDVIRSIETAATNGRMDVRAGDFFESVPSGAETYILSWVLHDWPDTEAIRILRSCRRAMAPTSRLVIMERLIDTEPAKCDAFDLLLDIQMLVLHGGQERTRAGFDALLRSAGFSSLNVICAQPTFSIFETRPAQQATSDQTSLLA
jgi:hypothetical protein